MLTIYTGADFFPPDLPPPVPMLMPWRQRSGRPIAAEPIFDDYARVAHTIFSETSLAAAAAGVLPFSWKYTIHYSSLRKLATDFAQALAAAGKRVIIFFDSDSVDAIEIPNAIVFRTSSYRSRSRPTEFGLPGWGQCAQQPLMSREKKTPVVGFCGYAPPLEVPLSRRKVKESVRWALARTGVHTVLNIHPGYFTRVEAIQSCRRTSGLKTNFLLRAEPSFVVSQDGWGTGQIRGTGEAGESFRPAFMNNMLESDYVLCTRGLGNYSFRLYEALSCGRIPVFVDTDCLLPFHHEPQWRSVVLWVDQAEAASVGERVLEFHSRVSPAAFLERQHAARQFWEQWLTPVSFFCRLAQTVAASAG
jgi:hypothetical protein